MPGISARGPCLYPELVQALAATGVPWSRIAREAGIRPQWLVRMRNGAGSGPTAEGPLKKLTGWLKKRGVKVEAKPVPLKGQPAPIPLPMLRTASGDRKEVDKLANMAREAKTHEACGDALAYLSDLLVRGVVDRFSAGAIESTIKARQASVKLEDEERRRKDSDKPVEVVVRYENDWLRKLDPTLACPLCAGTGLK